MKQSLLKVLLLCLLALSSTAGFAVQYYDCEIDGIYYYLNKTDQTARVTNRTNSYNSYRGVVQIPEKIEYEGVIYTVTSITTSAFRESENLKEVIISNSVTEIGSYAFDGCYNLIKVTIGDSVRTIDNNAFRGCLSLAEATIPDKVTLIGSNAFSACRAMSKLIIGKSVKTIGSSAFSNCAKLTEVIIPGSVTSIGNSAFSYCDNLKDVTFLDGPDDLDVTTSKTSTPFDYTPVEKLYLGRNISYYSSYSPFKDITSLKTLVIGDCVTSIGNSAFYNCSHLTATNVHDNITFVGDDAFHNCPNAARVKRNTKSLLSFWRAGYEPFEQESVVRITSPKIANVSATQTSVTVRVWPLYDEYTYYMDFDGYKKETRGEDVLLSGLTPETSKNIDLCIAMGDLTNTTPTPFYVTIPNKVSTASLSPTVRTEVTASSFRLTGSYAKGDADVTAQSIAIYKYNAISPKLTVSPENLIQKVDGNKLSLTGLNPNTTYTFVYSVIANDRTYTYENNVKTASLTLTTSQPKVVSAGNVIVAAESNLDDEETNVGFEWRRTDWTDDFASNTGVAYLYNGTMEGYIRNINTEKLWKYRPYYLSNSGTYYYGDWVGLDPTNTSYFEPTVHTYATINVEGNTALVKGYALTGTDKVTVQGFKYWKSVAGAKGLGNSLDAFPSDAMTVEASGQVMTAALTGLDFNATYHYVAFVTTSEGETFYGEEQMFSTGDDPTGIEDVYAGGAGQESVTVVARYNVRGERIDSPQSGVNILRMSDGTTRKVWVKKP